MTRDMNTFVAQALPHLPDVIEGVGFRPSFYLRTLDRLQNPDDATERCAHQHSKAFDQTLCSSIAAFARLSDVFTAARYANVTLP
ncbi:hypothetical protein [Tateyamaria omphalii]|uniref:hypothetical protein n=1 Tax=Tateyamaria omphalii TaxID=299262 RepID=UPI0016790540|nr:hypothetical protein [Tateyamaria omphalii]